MSRDSETGKCGKSKNSLEMMVSADKVFVPPRLSFRDAIQHTIEF